ncbi:RNA-guided endonuclease InsQ/TnpB family protein [Salinibacter ruber]|uniref:RNA-guided endonuclease InsQ/TnpB family protein n=1 Tax=Salinibacter ruber TaxID=146919 RepID=UPI00160E23D7|nr:RNA-guided endonuclease TnpB family protein [Salinibacter ruber]MBB4089894.1 IS605 OrfB family transposase [Salinibacter ruber]MCS3612975.1 IS605 OrfB family transposase [Salinibacter ruber]
MAITTKRKHIENTEVVRGHARAAGEVWTKTAIAWNELNERFGFSLSKKQAEALFAAQSLTENVQEACKEIPVIRWLACRVAEGQWEKGWDLSVPLRPVMERLEFESNPFVGDVMLQAGSQQRQQPIRRFYKHKKAFFKEHLPRWKENGCDPDEKPEPPYRKKRHARTDWVNGRWEYDGDTLRLKTGGGLDEIETDWPYPNPNSVQLVWDDAARKPMLCAQFDSDKQDLPDGFIRERSPKGTGTVGVDLGETYFAAAYDGEDTFILNGGKLRELRSLQRGEMERFNYQIEHKCEKGSNRWWKFVEAKNKRRSSIKNRIEDYLHKMSTRLVEECFARGADTIVFGDLTGIREDIDYGAKMNRRLHQWAFRQFIDLVKYKADRYGMTAYEIKEAYTSSTCPSCGEEVGTNNRRFRCSNCGYEAHRDQMGAVAIRSLFLDKEDEEDLERLSRSRVFEALRAWASGSEATASGPKGSVSEDKTQPSLSESDGSRGTGGAPTSTRATPQLEPPKILGYAPHMDCVFDP